MATYRSVNPGAGRSDPDGPGELRADHRPDDLTALIPRIARPYTPVRPLFPPWVTLAGISVLFGVCFALIVLFSYGIYNIVMHDLS